MNAQLNPQNAEHRLAHIAPDEDRFEPDPEPDPESDHHWPGDGLAKMILQTITQTKLTITETNNHNV